MVIHEDINLGAKITQQDAERQEKTVSRLLSLLETEPGVILADEVGMGKTFVALATALTYITNANRHKRILILTPSKELKDKWDKDIDTFRISCIREKSPLKKLAKDEGIDSIKDLLIKEKVDFLFYPSLPTVYPPGYKTDVQVKDFSDILEGESRPGHFVGVATVVLKLFNLINPTRAYFGQKDFQQSVVIKQMVRDLNLAISIIVVPTVRDKDGLALSSRNVFLNRRERGEAIALYQSLLLAKKLIAEGSRSIRFIKTKMKNYLRKYKLIRLDYIEICRSEDLATVKIISKKTVISITAFVGKTRLIDNVII